MESIAKTPASGVTFPRAEPAESRAPPTSSPARPVTEEADDGAESPRPVRSAPMPPERDRRLPCAKMPVSPVAMNAPAV